MKTQLLYTALFYVCLLTQAQGGIGVNTTTPLSDLDVNGNASIGAAYSGTFSAPSNGLIVEGQVGFGTNNPLASALLDVTSKNKGLLIPRVALDSTRDVTTIAAPATSLLVYNTATAGSSPTDVSPGFYYFDEQNG